MGANGITSSIINPLTTSTESWIGPSSTAGIYFKGGNVGIGTTMPGAILTLGDATINSVDSGFAIARTLNSGAGNAHGLSDSSNISRAGTIGYNSFDARVVFSGSNGFDHYAAFQAAPTYGTAGNTTYLYNFYSAPTITSGNIHSLYGLFVKNPIATAGTLTNNYGIYIDDLTAGQYNYALYSNTSAISYFKGNVGFGAGSPGKPIEVETTNGTESAIRLRQDGQNYWDLKSVASSTSFAISDLSGTYLTIKNGGNIGIGTTSPNSNALLDIASTTKAFLPPRMTKTQRDAIASPAAGMAVYQTDNTPGLRVYNGTNWMRFTETAD